MPLMNWAELVEESDKNRTTFEPLPPDTYDYVVDSAEHTTSQGGKDQFLIQARVESGPYANRKVRHYFTISPESSGAMNIFFDQMEAMGIPRDFFRSDPSMAQIKDQLPNRRFRARTAISTRNPNYNNLDRIFKAEGEAPPQAAPNAAPSPLASSATPTPSPAPASPAPTPTQAPAPTSPWDSAPATSQTTPTSPWGASPPPTPPVG